MAKPDIKRLIEFHAFLLQFQKIERSIALPGLGERKENDVEHSYFLAMAAWYLAPYFPQIDRDTAIRYALIHDLVETYAGDTNAFGPKKFLDSKKDREAAAKAQLEREWPDAPDMIEHIRRYEAKDSEEAKFVYTLDKNYARACQLSKQWLCVAQTSRYLRQLPRRKREKNRPRFAAVALLRTAA